jgi:hypothetical protein
LQSLKPTTAARLESVSHFWQKWVPHRTFVDTPIFISHKLALALRAKSRYDFPTMKKLLLASLVAAFACVSAVQAGEDCNKACAAKTACCAEKSACAKAAALAKARAQAAEKGAWLLVKR